MKRFWKDAKVVATGGGWGIELDGKPLRTPGKLPLVVPGEALAQSIAAEWHGAPETVDPRSMAMTGLANAAIERVATDTAGFAAGLARYGEADLTCYRAEGPDKLVERQAAAWDPLLAWARRRFAVDFAMTRGISHVPQPAGAAGQLSHAVESMDTFQLAALSPLVTIGGSLIAALAVAEGAVDPEAAWEAVSVDERWQIETWGDDAEAVAALEARKRDFLAAARFLALL
ncbi:MAG TPA: ATP12 family protein [Sphingomicrobium sp.]|nr:ATP12 family protein [Sphingomicrobium sp.]